ncbi:MAG TPA: BatD family protein, partial [Verrucomicrobiota bacterium]|nr:BatD family protein [Verrucomicrobiota bacterium]
EGFTIGNNGQGPQQRVRIGETDYTLMPLLIALTPVKTGKLELGPISASVVVELPSNRRNRDSLFEQFGMRDPFAGMNAERRQVILAADAQTLNCLPLPTDNVPANFTGAIGEYSLAVSAGPTNVAVGDPVTVRVQISGRGALQSVTLPDQAAWHDFKTYPSTSAVEPADALGIRGTKTFEQIVSPQNTDVRALPAFSFSYFDPEARAYRTLTEPPVPLSVSADRSAPLPAIAGNVSRQDNATPQDDILPIKQRLGTVASVPAPMLTQPWFVGLQTLPVLAFVAAFVWRKRTDSLAKNPRLRRQRHVAGIVRDGMNDLHRLARENKPDEFFATLFRLLQEQLGERLDRPASSITESVIDERLRPLGVDDGALASLHELFQACNLARYASSKSGDELAAHIPKLETALEQLKEVKA